ncbi:MAG: restriction endonuclease [Acidobacteria bacterium]|nr:restriction endonuclease [Acidobacteriota bacterium]
MRRGRLGEAQAILAALGLPPAQQNEISAYTLMALAEVDRRTPWAAAKRRSLRIHGMLTFMSEKLGKKYAENTRETIRRQVIHQLVLAHVADRNPDDPSLPTNHPRTHYAISEAALAVLRAHGSSSFAEAVQAFHGKRPSLTELYAAHRASTRVPVVLPSGKEISLSPGRHNELQAVVLTEFAQRFTPGATLLYLGDTEEKHLVVDRAALAALGVPVSVHDKLPDVVLHVPERGWLVLIEVVTSRGPVSPKRKLELEAHLAGATPHRIYLSAFPDFREFKKHLDNIAWETEVWIAEMPGHMIHFNGDKFLGPAAPAAAEGVR